MANATDATLYWRVQAEDLYHNFSEMSTQNCTKLDDYLVFYTFQIEVQN